MTLQYTIKVRDTTTPRDLDNMFHLMVLRMPEHNGEAGIH